MTADALGPRKTQVIAAVLGISLVIGGLMASLHPEMLADPANMQVAMKAMQDSSLNLVYQVAVLLLCFVWLEMDSRQLGIRRPWWLNLGIVFLTSIFVPYYLYKTRPQGQRGGAVLAYFGILFGSMVAMATGMYVAASFGGTLPTVPTGT